MSNEAFPIIDISSLDDFTQNVAEITQACRDWGFLILRGYGIPQDKIDWVYELNKDFCDLSQEQKLEFAIDERQIGYDLKHSKIGTHKSIVFGGTKGEILKTAALHAYWTSDKSAEIEEFKSACHELAQKLLRVFAIDFGLAPDYFAKAHCDTSDPPDILRMLRYSKFDTQPAADIPRTRAHTDWGSVTFVWPREEGLEVQSPSGEWIEVPLVPEGVVVSIGDALQLWSGRALKSTLHRISFDGFPIDKDRWSMSYFVNANKDAPLEVLQRQADGAYAPQPSGIVLTAGEYYDARMYESRRHDAGHNWVSKAKNLDHYKALLQKVEQVGVADSSVSVVVS
ncbi:hypothetical protein BDV19DRAFT_390498 [Aspergillus venezuelensis]